MANQHVQGGVVPYLTVDGAMKASEFYKQAFRAEIAAAHPPDDKGRTMHVHMHINGSSVMLSDAFPEHGHGLTDHAGYSLVLAVDDVDPWFERAVAAGCTAVSQPTNMFWGDRFAQMKDPFGVLWGINGPARG